MKDQLAIVGDVHGNVEALAGLLQILEDRVPQLVFVGDYVDRGGNSSAVLSLLIQHQARSRHSVFVAGNHDLAFRDFLQGGSITPFLRIGGAATILSYVGVPGRDVVSQMRETVPESHRAFLDDLRPWYARDDLVVTHGPLDWPAEVTGDRYHVFGHITQPSKLPKVRDRWAAIDTGCGSLPGGRLSGLLWPSREVVQAGSDGNGVN